jgi:aerobactin synthase
MMNQKNWKTVNQNLVAKSIGELTFEQVLTPIHHEENWKLELSSKVVYTFEGKMSIWEHLKIKPQSLKRNGEEVTSAAQFFIDSQFETKMNDIVLGNFLEEMHNTLYSDLNLLKSSVELTALELAKLDGEKIQAYLNGHPKILLNKGRIGFGAADLKKFSPEAKEAFQLHWIAVKNHLLQGDLPAASLLDECFDPSSKEVFLAHASTLNIDLKTYSFLPTHPWQWDKFLKIQFAALICKQEIISLGEAGDTYLPQISIRTLSNTSRPEKVDIKLPLTILNTSCIRGLPAKSISLGPKVSGLLDELCQTDSLLKESGVEILKEKAGVALLHPEYSQIKEAPYRYHEYLGSVWRESAKSKLSKGELAIITASLFFQDSKNNSLIGEYIRLSGLSKTEWLKKYFNSVVIPLYHLQLQYGVGMVAHGQNIILKLKDFAPAGMILKDFQGDLRLSTEMPEAGVKLFKEVANDLTKLPPHYLIHDLITGHFITVLRFISEVMEESDGLVEKDFYQILSQEIQAYTKNKNINEKQSLLNKTFPRVLLNKVRFAIGYSDSAERPLPMVGSDLLNPLYPQTK